MSKEKEIEYFKNILKKDPYAIVMGGSAYHIGAEEKQGLRGFGGAKFKIEFVKDTMLYKKGEIIESSNLWHLGDVPDEIEDTAKLTEDSKTKLVKRR